MGEREKPCRTPMTRRRMKGIVIDDFEAISPRQGYVFSLALASNALGMGSTQPFFISGTRPLTH